MMTDSLRFVDVVVVLAEAFGIVAGGCRSATHVPARTACRGGTEEIKSMG
jgi:hypothetical protein